MTYRYKLLFLFTALLTGIAGMGARETQPRVSPGIETLRQEDFAPLRGKRIGLITNPTGIDNSLRATVDILNEVPIPCRVPRNSPRPKCSVT